MSEAPERIWLQWFGDSDPDDPGEVYIDDVTWQDERIFDHDIEYVRADRYREAVELLHRARESSPYMRDMVAAIEAFLAGEEA